MGPSGAGKTTLLNMLTLAKKGGVPTGNVKYNGKPLTVQCYNENCAYVEQFDTLWSSLTAWDHMVYAMELYHPKQSEADRNAAIDTLMDELGLADSQHVIAGNQFLRGLSGGKKRRLSIAIALAKEPSVLFLDEPTTGVDSASAVMMMTFLKKIASAQNVAVLCTIHQPPASVFAGFDNNLILSMGRVAYFGKAAAMGEYFSSIGRPPPADTNLAEFVLDLVNKDFTPEAGVKEILDAWSSRAEGNDEQSGYGIDLTPIGEADESPRATERSDGAGFCSQVVVLTRRTCRVAVKEPLAYIARALGNLFTMIFFGIIYIKTREYVQAQVMSKTFFIMFSLGIPMMYVLLSTFIYYFDQLSIKREVKAGMYHPAAAALASWVVQVPMMFILGACSLVPTYIFADLDWSGFCMAWLIYSMTFWAFEGFAQASSVSPNVILALFGFINMYFCAFLFCGMFVAVDDVVWPLRVFCYVLPLGWSLESFMYWIYHDGYDYSGTEACTPGNTTVVYGPGNASASYLCDDRGFYCPGDVNGANCYGKTGDQILDSLSVQFTIFTSVNNTGRNIAIIIAFGVVLRFNFLFLLTAASKWVGAETPRPPSASRGPTPGSSAHSGNARKEASVAVDVDVPAPKIEAPEAAANSGEKLVYAFAGIGYSIVPTNKLGFAKGPPKEILADVSCKISQGEVMAIMGPSGSGKTTLLNTITFIKGAGTPVGQIMINGQTLTRGMYTDLCVYVPREDNLWSTMSPRQHLEVAYELYRPELASGSRHAAVDKLLAATGLESCQNTKAGGMFFQGLSGGQRRRLSLAIALVKEPRVIILDEPTSGLDSAAAAAITNLLKEMATSTGAAVLCTIHQPSAQVFATFDQVLFLSGGRVAYYGERSGIDAFFNSVHKPLGKDANPAEAVLDEISTDITAKSSVLAVLDAWKAASQGLLNLSFDGQPISLPQKRMGCGQTYKLFKRQFMLSLTDPMQYWARMVMAPFMTSFFGLVYRESANPIQVQVPFRLFYLWWVLAVPPCLNIISILILNVEGRSVVHEMKSGMYRPHSYVISTTLIQVPFMILMSLLIMACAYAIGGWPWDNFISGMLIYACSLWVFESLAQLLASVFANPIVGMLGFMMTWATSILFCGLVFKGSDVIWPFRLMYYIMPLRWIFNGLGYDIFAPAIYEGAYMCNPGDAVIVNNATTTCNDAPLNYYCPGARSSLECYGQTGIEILATLHQTYESLDIYDDRLMDVGILLGMVAFLKFNFFGQLWHLVSSSATPKSAAATKAAA